LTVAAALLCCCEPSECACNLTALSVQWTGGIQYINKCGLPSDYPCDPPVVVEVLVWDALSSVSVAGATVVQSVFGEQTVCDGFGVKSSPFNAPTFLGPCPPTECGGAIVTPTAPFGSANARIIGPYPIPGGWQVRVLLGNLFGAYLLYTNEEMAWIEGGSVGLPPPGVDLYYNRLGSGGPCPMVGAYIYDSSISNEPGNPDSYPSLALGYFPSWAWQGFSAGSVIVS
jgi:hypothetical protein